MSLFISTYCTAEQGTYPEITAEFFPSGDYAEIGQPFEMAYILNGGSGEFSDVTVQISFPRGSRTEYNWYSEKTDSKSGSSIFVPEEGKKLYAVLHGYDSAGKQFYIDMGYDIPILPNPDLPVSLQFNRSSIMAGETLEATYQIQGCSSFIGSASWTIGEKGEYWDKYSQGLGEQHIDSTAGTVNSIPAFGDYIYLVLQGKDESGRAVYIESESIAISDDSPTLNQLILPSNLKTIESEAFVGIMAESVVIPGSVSFIDDDAFAGSGIKAIYGTSDYAYEYAAEHGFEFKMME